MFFQNNTNQTIKYSRPSISVLQTESILIAFDKNGPLPFRLETNEVCDCVCFIMLSPSQGIAYLGHLYLKDLSISVYENSIKQIAKIFNLNSDNTFVALIGAQDEIQEKLNAFKDMLTKYFPNITMKTGGKSSFERAIELSDNKAEILTIDFAGKYRICAYEKLDINLNHTPTTAYSTVINIIYFNNGKVSLTSSPETIEKINQSLKDYRGFASLQQMINDSLPDRRLLTGSVRSKSGTEYQDNARLAKIRDALNLEKTQKVILNSFVYDCLIYRPNLFNFLKTYVGLEHTINFNYKTLNKFRYLIVQRSIKEKQITIEEVEDMTPFVETILSNFYHSSFLIKNLTIKEILALDENNLEIKKILSLLDELFISEEISPDQLENLSFEDIKKISNGEKMGIATMSRDTILHGGGRSPMIQR